MADIEITWPKGLAASIYTREFLIHNIEVTQKEKTVPPSTQHVKLLEVVEKKGD